MAKISIKTFKKALKDSGGNQSRIAERLECTRSAVGHFLKKNPKLHKLLESEAERVIDFAEDNIDTDIMINKDVDSSKWKLTNSKRGKSRGYGAKSEVEHSGESGSIVFNLVEKSVEEIKNAKLNNKPKASAAPKGTG
ncbi:MAG: hypothetical protein ACTSWD_04900 [Candidatus Heimdallarchaeota archaeon]